MGSSKARMPLQTCPQFRQEARPLCLYIDQSLDVVFHREAGQGQGHPLGPGFLGRHAAAGGQRVRTCEGDLGREHRSLRYTKHCRLRQTRLFLIPVGSLWNQEP